MGALYVTGAARGAGQPMRAHAGHVRENHVRN